MDVLCLLQGMLASIFSCLDFWELSKLIGLNIFILGFRNDFILINSNLSQCWGLILNKQSYFSKHRLFYLFNRIFLHRLCCRKWTRYDSSTQRHILLYLDFSLVLLGNNFLCDVLTFDLNDYERSLYYLLWPFGVTSYESTCRTLQLSEYNIG